MASKKDLETFSDVIDAHAIAPPRNGVNFGVANERLNPLFMLALTEYDNEREKFRVLTTDACLQNAVRSGRFSRRVRLKSTTRGLCAR